MKRNLRLVRMDHHRNGVGGAPFHVVIFNDRAEGRMLGVVFDQPAHVAVFQLDKLKAEDITFGSNSWRGDEYEPHLRRMVRAQFHEEEPDTNLGNHHRAGRCAKVLRNYGTDDNDPGALIDLLSDARHWRDQHGECFGELDRLAHDHYLAELHEGSGRQP